MMGSVRERVQLIVEQQSKLEDEIATAEEVLKDKKALLKAIGENDLPEAIAAFEQAPDETVDILTTRDGKEIVTEREYHANITKENAEEAHKWLRQNGYEAAIKAQIIVQFGLKELQRSESLVTMLQKAYPGITVSVEGLENDVDLADAILLMIEKAFPGVEVTTKYSVPGQTLKALVKKRLEGGKFIPDCISIYSPVKAKVIG
jgi:hypothetical protein